MLNIEVIKFEAQDVITASAVAQAPACKHPDPWNAKVNVGADGIKIDLECKLCGATGVGALDKDGHPYPVKWN